MGILHDHIFNSEGYKCLYCGNDVSIFKELVASNGEPTWMYYIADEYYSCPRITIEYFNTVEDAIQYWEDNLVTNKKEVTKDERSNERSTINEE